MFTFSLIHCKAENTELILRYMVSNEYLEDQGAKDALSNEAVTVMRLLKELLALTLEYLYETSISVSVTGPSSHGLLSLYYS